MTVLGALVIGCLLAHDAAPPGCSEQVERQYALGRHVEAARLAERCWEETGEPLMLYFAAQARAAVGQGSHAVVLLGRYLELLAPDAPQRPRAESKLAALQRELLEVTIEAPAGRLILQRDGTPERLELEWRGGAGSVSLEPGRWLVWGLAFGRDSAQAFVAAAGARVEVKPLKREAPRAVEAVELQVHVSPARALRRGGVLELNGPSGSRIAVPLRGATTRTRVTPGGWQATLRIPGREVLARGVQVRGPAELAFAPGLDRASKARLGLGIGLGAASVGLVGWGAAWVGRGRRMSDAPGSLTAALDGYTSWVDGAAVLSGGLGALGVAATDLLGARRLALVIETGVGGGLVLAGVTWREVAKDRLTAGSAAAGDTVAEETAVLDERRGREMSASVICGLGAGLLGAGAVSLVTMAVIERGERRTRRLEPVASPWGFGLRGRF